MVGIVEEESHFQLGKTVVRGNGKGTKIAYKVANVVSIPESFGKWAVIQRIEFLDPLDLLPNGRIQFRFCYYVQEVGNSTGAERCKFGQSAPFIDPTILAKLLLDAKLNLPGFAEILPK